MPNRSAGKTPSRALPALPQDSRPRRRRRNGGRRKNTKKRESRRRSRAAPRPSGPFLSAHLLPVVIRPSRGRPTCATPYPNVPPTRLCLLTGSRLMSPRGKKQGSRVGGVGRPAGRDWSRYGRRPTTGPRLKSGAGSNGSRGLGAAAPVSAMLVLGSSCGGGSGLLRSRHR